MYVRVKVTPGAKKETFKKISDTHFEISVKEKAERNMANERVRKILSAHFDLDSGKVRIVSGHRSPGKIFDISE